VLHSHSATALRVHNCDGSVCASHACTNVGFTEPGKRHEHTNIHTQAQKQTEVVLLLS
jgi:hypothetical protein